MFRKLLLATFLALASTQVEAANRFLTCNTTCTITAADTSIWGTTTGGTGASVPGSSDAVILDGATCVGGTTCTATMGAGYNPTWVSITMGACTASTSGCIFDFSPNDNNITLTSFFSNNSTGTRTLNMGDGTWTVTASAGTPWDQTTITNLTFNANASTLILNNSHATQAAGFVGGASLSYSTVRFIGVGGWFIGSTTNTFATLQATAPTAIGFFANATTTITNAIAITGTSSNPVLLFPRTVTTGAASLATIALGATSASNTWLGVRGLTFTTNAFSATNSLNLGGNTLNGGSITPPVVGSGTGIIGGGL